MTLADTIFKENIKKIMEQGVFSENARRKFRRSARVSVLYKKHSRCSAQSWVFANGRAGRSTFILGFDDENTILIHQISGLKTENSFF